MAQQAMALRAMELELEQTMELIMETRAMVITVLAPMDLSGVENKLLDRGKTICTTNRHSSNAIDLCESPQFAPGLDYFFIN